MTLLITLLLVLINLFGQIIRTQPPSKYPTALTKWTLVCIMFVTGALLAYAAILFNYFKQDSKSKSKVISVLSTWDIKGPAETGMNILANDFTY